MKKRMLGIIFVLVMVLASCSKGSSDRSYKSDGGSAGLKSNESTYPPSYDAETGYDMSEINDSEGLWTDGSSEGMDESKRSETGSVFDESSLSLTTNPQQMDPSEKIIHRRYLDIETQEFDDLVRTISREIEMMGGYIESSEIRGRRTYKDDSLRWGEIKVRVPQKRLNEFVENISQISNVVLSSGSTENVTLEFIDTDSRKKSLQIEQDRMFALLEKAETLKEIMDLESRISSLRYEIQRLESSLRRINNDVEYSQVSLSIKEVVQEEETPEEETEKTFAAEIKEGFQDTMESIKEGLQDFVIGTVVILPYLVIWAVVIGIISLILRRIFRRSKKDGAAGKAENREDEVNK